MIVVWKLHLRWIQEQLAQTMFYRNFWKICQLQQPITIQKSTKVTKLLQNKQFLWPNAQLLHSIMTQMHNFSFHEHYGSAKWRPRTFSEKFFASSKCPESTLTSRDWNKNPSKSICYDSFHQNKSYLHLSQILSTLDSYTMCIDAMRARCWKYLPKDTHTHFPPGSTFQRNRNAVATGLSFIQTIYTWSERSLPTLVEITKNIK